MDATANLEAILCDFLRMFGYHETFYSISVIHFEGELLETFPFHAMQFKSGYHKKGVKFIELIQPMKSKF